MDLQTATPAEIDTALADLYDQADALAVAADRAADNVLRLADMRLATESAHRLDRRTVGTLADARAKVTDIAANGAAWDARDARKAIEALDNAIAAIRQNRTYQRPMHLEFRRRGGWTRAFLVLNTGGHVHRNMECSTCFPTTRYGWLPQVSGHDEAEIVAGAGSDACTVCYPTAPVEQRKARTLLHASEVEAQAARDARARAKAERDAKRAAKAITGTDGERLTVERGTRFPEHLDTAAAAKKWLTDAAVWGTGHPSFTPEDVTRVAEALAAKFGTTVEAEREAAAKRAARRR